MTPSRTSCAAEPCAVFFTTNGAIADQYVWNFGDGQNGQGFQAGHVFERPGIYRVSLSVTSATTGLMTSAPPVDIVVHPFSGFTYYVDALGGNDANSGLSPTQPWATAEKINTFLNTQPSRTNYRFLLRRGQTFYLSDGRWINRAPHPLTTVRFGAYGSMALPAPIVRENPNRGLSSSGMPMMDLAWSSDVVVQDIVFRGNYSYVYKNPLTPYGHFYPTYAADLNPGVDHVVFLRVEIDHLGEGILATQIAPDVIQNLFIHDSYIHHTNGVHVFGQARGYSLLNNRLEYASNFHLQYAHTDDAAIVGNTWKGAGVNIVNPSSNPPEVWYQCGTRITEATGRIYLAQNHYSEISGTPLCMGHNTPTHTIDDVLIERNTFDGYVPPTLDHWDDGGVGGFSAVHNGIFRNNIALNPRGSFNVSGATNNTTHVIYPSSNIQIINNVFYTQPGNVNSTYIRFASPVPAGTHDVKVLNNIFYGTFGGTYGISSGAIDLGFGALAIANLEIDYNLYDRTDGQSFFRILLDLPYNWAFPYFSQWQSVYGFDLHSLNSQDPGFISTEPSSPDFLKLGSTSPAIDHGSPVQMRQDFYGNSRPQGAGWDMGIAEQAGP